MFASLVLNIQHLLSTTPDALADHVLSFSTATCPVVVVLLTEVDENQPRSGGVDQPAAIAAALSHKTGSVWSHHFSGAEYFMANPWLTGRFGNAFLVRAPLTIASVYSGPLTTCVLTASPWR